MTDDQNPELTRGCLIPIAMISGFFAWRVWSVIIEDTGYKGGDPAMAPLVALGAMIFLAAAIPLTGVFIWSVVSIVMIKPRQPTAQKGQKDDARET